LLAPFIHFDSFTLNMEWFETALRFSVSLHQGIQKLDTLYLEKRRGHISDPVGWRRSGTTSWGNPKRRCIG